MRGYTVKLKNPCRHISLFKTEGRENPLEQWFVQFKRLDGKVIRRIEFFISDEAIHALLLLYIDSGKSTGRAIV